MASSVIRRMRCNIVVLGKTGAGKSTVANSIVGQQLFEVGTSVRSVTRGIRNGEAKFTEDDVEYNIKLIDTVGLFDTGGKTNEQAIDEIKKHFQNRVPEGVNLILFVYREGRFTREEKDTFDFIIKKFSSEISEISALVITNCDTKSDRARENVKDEFCENTVTKPIADFVKKGIFVVGFPKLDDVDDEDKPRMEEKMEKDRKKLQALVRSCEGEPRLSKDLFSNSFWEKCHIL